MFNKKFIAITAISVFALWVSAPFLYLLYEGLGFPVHSNDGDGLGSIGKFGDSFGAFTSLITGLSMVGICITLYYNKLSYDSQASALERQIKESQENQKLIHVQSNEMKAQTELMHRQFEEMQEQKKERGDEARRQIIYKMIDKIDREMQEFDWYGGIKGVDAIIKVHRGLKNNNLQWGSGECSERITTHLLKENVVPRICQLTKLIKAASIEIREEQNLKDLLKSIVTVEIGEILYEISKRLAAERDPATQRVRVLYSEIPGWAWE